MKKPSYRLNSAAVRDIAVAVSHAEHKDEIGLTHRQKVIARALRYAATERMRQCIYLYFYCGLMQPEIAKRLEITVSTVSRNISNGLGRVEDALYLAGMEGVYGTTAD